MSKKFVEVLIELMEEKDMTQVQLANLIGTTNVTISRYISGERNPRIEIVTKIAEVFNVSTDYLLGLTDNRYFSNQKNDKELVRIKNKLDELGLLNSNKKLSNSQIELIEKLIEANREFILNLKDDVTRSG